MADIGNQTGSTGSTRSLTGATRGILITTTEAGTVDSVSAYLSNCGTDDVQFGIWDASGNLLASSTVRSDVGNTGEWKTFTGFGDLALSASTDYVVAGYTSGVSGLMELVGTGDTFDGRLSGDTGLNPLSDPTTFSLDSARDYQIYITYTPSGGANPKGVLGGVVFGGPFGGPIG